MAKPLTNVNGIPVGLDPKLDLRDQISTASTEMVRLIVAANNDRDRWRTLCQEMVRRWDSRNLIGWEAAMEEARAMLEEK